MARTLHRAGAARAATVAAIVVAGLAAADAVAAVAPAPAGPALPPLVDSRCAAGGGLDARFRDGALDALRTLAVRAPGRSADGALRAQASAGHVDPAGRGWQPVHAYAGNLAWLGALRLDRTLLPLAERWLRWQVREIALDGPRRGVAPDRWVRVGDLEQSSCPAGLAPQRCASVDADDSTVASTLLLADAFVRHGGDAAVLREPAVRAALEAAAQALRALAAAGGGLTLASTAHPAVYTMDQTEVVAARRAWARLLAGVYAQPASAAVERAAADAAVAAMRARLGRGPLWAVSADAGEPDLRRWYPDTVAQAWPLLWGIDAGARRGAAWSHASAAWPRRGDVATWAVAPPDPDGFRWAAAAVAARCSGDAPSARAWTDAARRAWLDAPVPFAWPFHVGELLWLTWLADPVDSASPASPSSPVPTRPDQGGLASEEPR